MSEWSGYRSVRTFTPIPPQIPLTAPLLATITASIKFCLHFMPGEHDGTGVAVDVFGWVAWLREVFDEVYGEVAEEGKVEGVEPDHRFLSLQRQ